MAKPILKDIKISELVVDDFNVRKGEWNPNDDDENKLIDSIKAQGVLEPMLVRPVKGQATKYPKNKKWSIVCGSRRYHASMEARQKTIPCVVRTDLNDMTSLGTSIQENLKRRSMDKTQTADGVGRMWGMLNGGRTYEQKINEINKLFGIKKRQIEYYLNQDKLYKSTSEKFKQMHHGAFKKVDTHTLSEIQTAKHLTPNQKEELIILAESIEKPEERRVTISEVKKKTKEDGDLGIAEAYEKYEKEVDETIGESFDVYLNAKERKATKDSAHNERLEINTLIKRNHVNWLKKENYL